MVDAKWCCENLNSGDIKIKNIIDEVKELMEARSINDMKEEFGDVIYFWNCWLYYTFKINLPMIGAMDSIAKFVARLEVWERIFSDYKLKFDRKYLINGSNYTKEEKRRAALDLAIKEQRGM